MKTCEVCGKRPAIRDWAICQKCLDESIKSCKKEDGKDKGYARRRP